MYGDPSSVSGQTLTFDALGRMVEDNSAGNEYVYAPGLSQVFAVMNGATPVQTQFPLPLGGIAVYFYPDTTPAYARPDWLGSSRLLTNSVQRCLSDRAYAPFGEEYSSSWGTSPMGSR